MDTPSVVKRLPIIEVFGPTIQGEGAMVGQRTAFIRLGYCDYRCVWCDTMYAVDPAQVQANKTLMTPAEVVAKLGEVDQVSDWVTLSGGNPAMHDLTELVRLLHEDLRLVAVETQGSLAPSWLQSVDLLTVSPKPPSSHMDTDEKKLDACLRLGKRAILKIVVFDEVDYEYAVRIASTRPQYPLFLSVGTPQSTGLGKAPLGQRILHDYQKLVEHVLKDERLPNVTVLPQLHTVLWGQRRGV